MRFKNLRIWRERLPHWRADDVVYYATFRYRRDLNHEERELLFRALVKSDGRKFDVFTLGVWPDRTELVFRTLDTSRGIAFELSKVLGSAKSQAGRAIIQRTGERFPPFYEESYDRIIRDDEELMERIEAIASVPVSEGLAAEAEAYSTLYLKDA